MKAHNMFNWTLCIIITVTLIHLCMSDQPTHAAENKENESKKHKHTNKLVNETSPYLLQHAHNPVNWYPWGDEAFAKAKAEDKPIFLSVGYSTCHWCHVMERESFEREDVAKILNEHYICIKVDREERPDVDAQYMLATQIFTRRGGWPNSVWLTPDGRPWFAGTYFPREDQGGRPGFKTILNRLSSVWENQRNDVEQQANAIAEEIRKFSSGAQFEPVDELKPDLLQKYALSLHSRWDQTNGGFGGAPKFPPHSALSSMIYAHRQKENPQHLKVLASTLDAMMLGGMHDHLAGGFHRYSTDAKWVLPHFEKMLYDNAQLTRLYTDGYLLTKDERYKDIVADIYHWIKTDMIDPKGGFYSAIDADSEGEEGKFYVWHISEIEKILGKSDAATFIKVYSLTDEGNYLEEATGERVGTNVIYMQESLKTRAEELKTTPEALGKQLQAMREKLLVERNKRIRPHLDDKVVTSWNGLMIDALAYAGMKLNNKEYIAAAKNAADFILKEMRTSDGRLRRTWRKGSSNLPGYVEDYAFFIEGLLTLHTATKDDTYLNAAKSLADIMITDFEDKQKGGFYYASKNHDELFSRVKSTGGGGNIPDANGIAALSLIHLYEITKHKPYLEAAEGTLRSHSGQITEQPSMSDDLLITLNEYTRITGKESFKAAQLADTTKADHQTGKDPVYIKSFLSRNQVTPGSTVYVAFDVTINPGWHVYSNELKSEFYIPFEIKHLESDNTAAGQVKYPPAVDYDDKATETKLKVYEGRFYAVIPVTIKDNAKGEVTLKFEIQSQACDDKTCLMKENFPVEIKLNIADKNGPLRYPDVFKKLDIK